MPEPKDLHVDSILSNVSLQYKNEEHIWPQVLPVVKVNKLSDKYFIYTKSDSFRVPDDALGPTAMPNESTWSTSTANYSVAAHGLGDWLAEETVANADNPIQPAVDTVEFLTRQLELAQEKRVADLVFLQGSYPSANRVQLSGTGQWSGSADDPIGDITTGIEACFQRANTLVFGVDAWVIFRKLSEILDAVKSSTRLQSSPGGLATESEVAGLFGVDRVVIGRARKITTKRGQTDTYARVWGKHCAVLHVSPSPGIRSISFGFTFAESLMQTTKSELDVKRGVKGATYYKNAWNSDEKIVASDVGYLIEDAVA